MVSYRARRPFSRRSEARQSGEGLLLGPAGLRAGPRRGAGFIPSREGRPPGLEGKGPRRNVPRVGLDQGRGALRDSPPQAPSTLATDRNGAAPGRPSVFVFTGSCSPASTWPLPYLAPSEGTRLSPSGSRMRRSTSDAQRLPRPVSYRSISPRPALRP